MSLRIHHVTFDAVCSAEVELVTTCRVIANASRAAGAPGRCGQCVIRSLTASKNVDIFNKTPC